MSHPFLDWALLGGWLLGSVHQWRQQLKGNLLGEELSRLNWNSRYKFGTRAASLMELIDASDGADQFWRYQSRFDWKHALACGAIAGMFIYYEPEHWALAIVLSIAWLGIDRLYQPA